MGGEASPRKGRKFFCAVRTRLCDHRRASRVTQTLPSGIINGGVGLWGFLEGGYCTGGPAAGRPESCHSARTSSRLPDHIASAQRRGRRVAALGDVEPYYECLMLGDTLATVAAAVLRGERLPGSSRPLWPRGYAWYRRAAGRRASRAGERHCRGEGPYEEEPHVACGAVVCRRGARVVHYIRGSAPVSGVS